MSDSPKVEKYSREYILKHKKEILQKNNWKYLTSKRFKMLLQGGAK